MKNTTLSYYNTNAQTYVVNTRDVSMNDAYEHFLKYIPSNGTILDFGCGSGRDTKYFRENGYNVDAVDGSEELCRLAREYAGIPVKQMLFRELSERDAYDGIWACSSILHLPKDELAIVFDKMTIALKKDGIIYASFKYGTDEGERNGRYFTDFTEQSLRMRKKNQIGTVYSAWWHILKGSIMLFCFHIHWEMAASLGKRFILIRHG